MDRKYNITERIEKIVGKSDSKQMEAKLKRSGRNHNETVLKLNADIVLNI